MRKGTEINQKIITKKDTGYKKRKEKISRGKVKKEFYPCRGQKKGKRREKLIIQRGQLRNQFEKATEMTRMSKIMKTMKIMRDIGIKSRQGLLKKRIMNTHQRKIAILKILSN